MARKSQVDFVKTALRIPPELHARVHESAESNGRTYNAELIARLEQSFEERGIESMTVAEVIEEAVQKSLAEAEKRIAHINRSLLVAEYAKAGITYPPLGTEAPNEDYPARSARQQMLDARDNEIEALGTVIQELLHRANEIGPEHPDYQDAMAKVAELRALETDLRESADALHRGRRPAPRPNRKTKS